MTDFFLKLYNSYYLSCTTSGEQRERVGRDVGKGDGLYVFY